MTAQPDYAALRRTAENLFSKRFGDAHIHRQTGVARSTLARWRQEWRAAKGIVQDKKTCTRVVRVTVWHMESDTERARRFAEALAKRIEGAGHGQAR